MHRSILCNFFQLILEASLFLWRVRIQHCQTLLLFYFEIKPHPNLQWSKTMKEKKRFTYYNMLAIITRVERKAHSFIAFSRHICMTWSMCAHCASSAEKIEWFLAPCWALNVSTDHCHVEIITLFLRMWRREVKK